MHFYKDTFSLLQAELNPDNIVCIYLLVKNIFKYGSVVQFCIHSLIPLYMQRKGSL
jgi:hypothetical protein